MILRTNNRIALIETSADYIARLAAAIDSAKNAVFLESYIFANDSAGKKIAESLTNAARRGVAVHVVLDGFGAKNAESDFLPAFDSAGVKLLFFRPERKLFAFKRSRFRRLHRKLAVIDFKTAFVGGMNIDADPPGTTRLDFACEIEGDVVADIFHHVLKQWQSLCRSQKKFLESLENNFEIPKPPKIPESESADIAFLVRDNLRHRHDILNSYLRAIQSAQSEIVIANAYFLPGLLFGNALLNAAARGVKIKIILQGNSDIPLMLSATRFLYSRLNAAGIDIYEYQPGLLHAKVAVIDSRWVTIGSSNMDPFSLRLNKEANVLALSPFLAAKLQKNLAFTVENHCIFYGGNAAPRLTLWQKMVQAACFFGIRAIFKFLHYNATHWDDQQKRF